MELVTAGVAMGLGATLAMDLWALLLNRLAGQKLPNWAAVGRWVGQAGQGRLFHADIGAVPSAPGELALGWAFHYAVGVIYGVVFALLAGPDWLASPSFLPAWIFALVTIAAGWFLLQPGMGLGWAASRTPAPWKVRAMGLLAHSVFGLGLWGTALLLG
ncbi:DUF2938 domain-containing protein [Oceanibium sediminis]|uniref:DUF2938 domain-containing protein n=1 Tax=Oceanibium sediminis TaxID=2026339 RepID=UPI000DD43610|nr:DUF2938 domain-containing protein [Oceanibium sediminis]